MVHEKARKGLQRLRVVQWLIALMLTALFFYIKGTQAAYSAMLGGLICIIPCMLFARRVFHPSHALVAKRMVKALYVGEAAKLALTMVLFWLVFYFTHAEPMALFYTFILVQAVFWLTPVLFRK